MSNRKAVSHSGGLAVLEDPEEDDTPAAGQDDGNVHRDHCSEQRSRHVTWTQSACSIGGGSRTSGRQLTPTHFDHHRVGPGPLRGMRIVERDSFMRWMRSWHGLLWVHPSRWYGLRRFSPLFASRRTVGTATRATICSAVSANHTIPYAGRIHVATTPPASNRPDRPFHAASSRQRPGSDRSACGGHDPIRRVLSVHA